LFINNIIQTNGRGSHRFVANFLLPTVTENTLQVMLILNVAIILWETASI